MAYKQKLSWRDYLGVIAAIILGLLLALAIMGGMILQNTRFIYIIQRGSHNGSSSR
jgi:hypothetical protein